VARYVFLLKTYPQARDCLISAKGRHDDSALCRVIQGGK
jgi:hypothetical protein